MSVKIYDKALTDLQCEFLVDAFNNSEDTIVRSTSYLSFTEFNFTQHFNGTEFHVNLAKRLTELTQHYFKDINIKPYFKPGSFEEVRVKRYDANANDRFDIHIDAADAGTSKRAVAMLFYLNDNDGYTDFPTKNIRVEPKKGRVVVFPPTWEYPHLGNKPSTEKYIMSSYLHYG